MDKPRMGRPPKSGNETLSERVIIRLTPSELTAYDQVAESAGLDRSEWIRAVLNKSVKSFTKHKRPD